MLTRLRSALAYLARRRRFDRELHEEMTFHRDMLVRDEERLGRSRVMAMSNARRRMGNVTLMAEQSRDVWIVAWLDALVRDVRYCLRGLVRHPGFTTVVVLTLALGIGANTAIFRIVDAVMLRGLPVSHPDDLLLIRSGFSYPRYQKLRDRNDVFSDVIGSHTMRDVVIATGDRALGRGATSLVTGNYFSFLGVQPILGRPILPEDDRASGAGPVAVISQGLWQRSFGGSPDVLGRKLRLHGGEIGSFGTSGFEADDPAARRPDEVVLTIVGVAPAQFTGDRLGTLVDLWTPMTMQPALMPGRAWLTRDSAFWVSVMGRRRPGVGVTETRTRLTELLRQIRTEEIGPAITDRQRRNLARMQVDVDPGAKGFGEVRREFSAPLLILMAVVTLVLLIACLNVANLLLARATARRHEISMRLSLGASRARLIRQLLTESVLLAAAGGLVGLVVAVLGAAALVRLVSADVQQIALRLEPDWRMFAFTAGVSIASGILFGLAPALRATRRDLHHTLKEAARAAGGGRRGGSAKALVSVQIAVSLVLLVACGLFLRTLYNLKTEALGYDRDGLIIARVDPVGAGYRGDAIGRASVELLHRLAPLPGVKSATLSENGLFSGVESQTGVDVEGFKPTSDEDRAVRFDQVGPGYFTNVGIPLVLGRDITEHDGPGAPPVAVINDTMARFYFPNANPIGKHIGDAGVNTNKPRLEIVGVARDTRDHDVRGKPQRRFYVSYLQPIDGITTANFEVRAAGNPSALFGAIRAEIARFDPKLTILSVKTAQTLVDENIVAERLIAKLSSFFGALAVLLAAIGLYGVMSYAVARRTSEIGLRMALGARQGTVASMVLREILILAGVGCAVGLLSAFALTRYVSGLVYGLTPTDPLTFGGSIALLLTVAVLSGYLPARRAARIDPVVALRHE
jgi:predicted permease